MYTLSKRLILQRIYLTHNCPHYRGSLLLEIRNKINQSNRLFDQLINVNRVVLALSLRVMSCLIFNEIHWLGENRFFKGKYTASFIIDVGQWNFCQLHSASLPMWRDPRSGITTSFKVRPMSSLKLKFQSGHATSQLQICEIIKEAWNKHLIYLSLIKFG